MTHNIETLDFDTVDDFVEEIVDDVLDEDEYTNCTVVANYDLINTFIRKLLEIEYESFDLTMVDINSVDYGDLYYLTITSDLEIFCEPVYHDGIQYLNESDYTYVYEDVNWSVLDKLGDDSKFIFGIDELNEE